MPSILIKSAQIVNEDSIIHGDVYIQNGRIEQVAASIARRADRVIDAEGLHLLPGLIDDQVHFREPGLTHKADIWHESRAAVAGGTTSFMEMPNTVPNTLTQRLLQDKFDIAAKKSLANYSFYMGAANDNIEEVLKTDPKTVCGIKVFMGASTGNMLVDDERTLERIFSRAPGLVAVHCEDETTVRANLARFEEEYGAENLQPYMHPLIRSEEACWLSAARRWHWPKSTKRACTSCTFPPRKRHGCSLATFPFGKKGSLGRPASTISGFPTKITPPRAISSSGTQP